MINTNNSISGVTINGTFSGDGSGLTGISAGTSGTSGTRGTSGLTIYPATTFRFQYSTASTPYAPSGTFLLNNTATQSQSTLITIDSLSYDSDLYDDFVDNIFAQTPNSAYISIRSQTIPSNELLFKVTAYTQSAYGQASLTVSTLDAVASTISNGTICYIDLQTASSNGAAGTSGTSGANGTSGTSGGGAAGPTMFNSMIAPATQSTFPYYKLNVPAITFSGTNLTTANNTIYFVNTNLSAGEVINEVALLVTNVTGLTTATYTIGLYSTTTDSAGRFYANTLVQTLGTITFTTTGRKTVTGIGYTVPSSTNGIYYVGLAAQVTGTSPQIFGPVNSVTPCYYASLDGSTMQRQMMLTTTGTLPSSISISTWLSYTNNTSGIYYIGFRS